MRFQLWSGLLTAPNNYEQSMLQMRSLNSATAFLQQITRMSPFQKDTLRHVPDFGFVLLTYSSVFVLNLLGKDAGLAEPCGLSREGIINDVLDVAELMRSFGRSSPENYGRALQRMCLHLRAGWRDAGHVPEQSLHSMPPTSQHNPMEIPAEAVSGSGSTGMGGDAGDSHQPVPAGGAETMDDTHVSTAASSSFQDQIPEMQSFSNYDISGGFWFYTPHSHFGWNTEPSYFDVSLFDNQFMAAST